MHPVVHRLQATMHQVGPYSQPIQLQNPLPEVPCTLGGVRGIAHAVVKSLHNLSTHHHQEGSGGSSAHSSLPCCEQSRVHFILPPSSALRMRARAVDPILPMSYPSPNWVIGGHMASANSLSVHIHAKKSQSASTVTLEP